MGPKKTEREVAMRILILTSLTILNTVTVCSCFETIIKKYFLYLYLNDENSCEKAPLAQTNVKFTVIVFLISLNLSP